MAWTDAARRASAEARRRGRTMTLYHGTTAVAARAIRARGFRPTGHSGYPEDVYRSFGGPMGATYLSSSAKFAKEFAIQRAMQQKRVLAAVLKVKVPVR